ncbi:MAG: hypothetical protein ACRDZO_01430 [Egibacteraceae bacterium]
MTVEFAAILLAWVAIVLLGFALAGVLRQLHELRSQLGPQLSATGPAPGQPLLAEAIGTTGLMLFVSRTCGACAQVLPEVARIAAERPRWAVEVCYRDEPGALEVPGVRVRGGKRALFDALGITITPFAVTTDGRQVVVAAPTGSPAALRALADRHEELERAHDVAS